MHAPRLDLDQRRTRGAVVAVGGVVTLLAAWALHVAWQADVDDAWIHLRVAHNFAHGHGPVFNVGERVEASTSPLWTALLALAIRLGGDGPAAALGLSLVSAAAVGCGAALLGFRFAAQHKAMVGLLAALLTAGNITFTYWASTRMEVSFACALLIWSINLALSTTGWRTALGTGLLSGCAALARPELLSVVPLVVALAVAHAPREARRQVAIAAATVACAIVGTHLLLRYSYYGMLVPNTYVAKVAGKGLAARLAASVGVIRDFISFQPLLLIPFGWAAIRARGEVRLLSWGCGVLLAAVAWTGGDHFQYCRLAVPLIPILSAVAAVLLGAVAAPLRLAATALLLLQAPVGWKRQGWRAIHSGTYVLQTEAVARAVKRLPAGPIATLGIGVLGYRCPERRVIDLVGLADAHIARSPRVAGAASGHDHSDPNYVVDQAPAIVLLSILTTDQPLTAADEARNLESSRYWYQSGLDLLLNSRFVAGYAPRNLTLDDGRFIRVWLRRDLATSSVRDLGSGAGVNVQRLALGGTFRAQ